MGWPIHLHLIAAIAWIGGSIFMFVLGVTLLDKKKQKEVYPHIGPIFGYFELVSLAILLATGIFMIIQNGMIDVLFSDEHTIIIDLLIKKLLVVLLVLLVTVVHFVIAYKTVNTTRTKLQNILSRGSSLIIFFANLFILHYAIMIRHML